MRIPLVPRVRIKYAVISAVVLFAIQQVEGTDLYFSGLVALMILLTTISFNAAGGFTRPSGSFIFFFAALTSLLGQVVKVFLGEAGDSVFAVPRVTMGAYCVTMALMGLTVALVRRVAPRQGLLAGMGVGEEMKKAAVGSLILGLASTLYTIATFTPTETGTLLSAFRQINLFLPMSILLATFYQVKKTQGEQSTNWVVWTSGIFLFSNGFVGYSKEGMFSPFVTWLVAAIAAGKDFSRKQLLLLAGIALFAQFVLVPFAQYGRIFRNDDQSFLENARFAVQLFGDIGSIRRQDLASEREALEEADVRPHCFNQSVGFLERLCVMGPDDALTAYTEQGHEIGYASFYWSFANLIPHFIWKDKPYVIIGNQYAREMGNMISEDDETTGVSFSPMADAYHQGGWRGLVYTVPPVMFILFFVMESLSGDLRVVPWGLLFVVLSSHVAPEGLLGGQLYLATFTALGVVLIALMSKYFLPIVGGLITGTDRTRVRKSQVVPFGVRREEAESLR